MSTFSWVIAARLVSSHCSASSVFLYTMQRVPVPSALTRRHCSATTASPLWPGSVFCHRSPPSDQSKVTDPHRDMFTGLSKPLRAQSSGLWVNMHRMEGLKAE